jgi:hypothetical protein
MSKEKFEIVFLAGGALLDVLAHRLRRPPANAREAVGAAMNAVEVAAEAWREQLPEPENVAAQLGAVRAELCAERPHKLLLSAYLEQLAYEVKAVDELAEAVSELQARVDAWLG